MSAAPLGPYRAGEIPPPIICTFQDASGAPIALSGFSARFEFRRFAALVGVTNSASADQGVGATKGQVTYAWVAADLATPGDYWGEFWVGNGINRYRSVRYEWTVTSSISVPAI